MPEDLGKMMFPMPTDEAFKKGKKLAENYEQSIQDIDAALNQVSDTMEGFGEETNKSGRNSQTWGITTVQWANQVVQAFKIVKKFATGMFSAISGAISPDISLAQQAFTFDITPETLDAWQRTALMLGESAQTINKSFGGVAKVIRDRSLYTMPGGKYYLAAQDLGINPEKLFKMGTQDATKRILEGLREQKGKGAETSWLQVRAETLGLDAGMVRIMGDFKETLSSIVSLTRDQMDAQFEILQSVREVSDKWAELKRNFLVQHKDAIGDFLQSLENLADFIDWIVGKDSLVYGFYSKIKEKETGSPFAKSIVENAAAFHGEDSPFTWITKILTMTPGFKMGEFGLTTGASFLEDPAGMAARTMNKVVDKLDVLTNKIGDMTHRVIVEGKIETPYGDVDILYDQVASAEGG